MKMKKIKLKMKRYVFPLAAGLMVAAGVSAQQQDSLLRRQMELERQFNPTLKDAAKIVRCRRCRTGVEKTEHGVCFVGGMNESAV